MKSKILKIIFVLAIFLIGTQSVHATSGACSSHGGVNCSAGMQPSGTVYCNDSGWTNSMVQYDFMAMCQDQELATIDDYCDGTVKQTMIAYTQGKDQYMSYVNDLIQKGQNELTTTDMGNPTTANEYNNYMNMLYTLKGLQTKRENTYIQGAVDKCKTDQMNKYISSLQPVVQPVPTIQPIPIPPAVTPTAILNTKTKVISPIIQKIADKKTVGYIVKAGDTLYDLYGDDWKILSGYTGDPSQLKVGTVLNNFPY